jgi:uncharacterized protein YecT (DUF1311 family)
MGLSGQMSKAKGAGTALYRVLFNPYCAWVVAVILVMPVVAAAQQPGVYKTDKKRILACIASVERTLPPMWGYGFPSNGSADRCILAETDRCIGDNQSLDQLPQATRSACIVAELEIWEQLLKESYDAAVDKLSALDRHHPTPEAALPLFEAAHRAWQAWAEVECEYQRALAKEGSDRFSIGTSCKVVMTARRVLHYRSSI